MRRSWGSDRSSTFHTRSDHQARDALYEIDHLLRFYHAQIHDERATQPELYIRWNALGEAIRSPTRRVVLIDEIDKAPRDFPNDLLDEIDQMEFRVPELAMTFRAAHRPVVIITSNSERQLPDPFLRRCVFHRIEFPASDRLQAILAQRLGHLESAGAADRRPPSSGSKRSARCPGLEKKPATGELIAWVKVLRATGVDVRRCRRGSRSSELPSPGALRENRTGHPPAALGRLSAGR